MIGKLLALVSIITIAVGAPSKPPAYHPHIFLNLNHTRLIQCYKKINGVEWQFSGTGFVIAKNIIVTANHVVTGQSDCVDAATQLPVKTYYHSNEKDLALLSVDTGQSDNFQKYSCEGFKKDHHYTSAGYAFGTDLIVNDLIATGKKMTDHVEDVAPGFDPSTLTILKGDIFHGMSGGPIFNDDGFVVGINTASDGHGTATSRALKDTILCKR